MHQCVDLAHWTTSVPTILNRRRKPAPPPPAWCARCHASEGVLLALVLDGTGPVRMHPDCIPAMEAMGYTFRPERRRA